MWVWLLLLLPVIAVVADVGRFPRSTTVAIVQDATPLLLLPAWPALVVAIAEGRWVAAVVAALLVAHQVGLMRVHRRRRSAPEWVRDAPTLRIAMGNVFVHNERPDTAADVVVVVETTPDFREVFDRNGGDRYPHRAFDPDDDSEYAVAVYASDEPDAIGMVSIGALRAARVVTTVAGVPVQVLGVLPHATVEQGGLETWSRQMAALRRWVRAQSGALVVVGDLNASVYRPGFHALVAAGLRDAHETLGAGLRPSFQLAARGPLAAMPVIRLDHALTNRDAWPVDVEDLPAEGSDHRPFVVTVALRADRLERGRRWRLTSLARRGVEQSGSSSGS